MQYFVIHNGDGDTTVNSFTKEELEKRLAEKHWGDDIQFLDDMPIQSDTNYWETKFLIIKGDIVVPKPIEVVKLYEV